MTYTMWRGVLGMVKPTRRPGSLEELIRALPEGIGVVPLLLNVREGSRDEFGSAVPHSGKFVAELPEQGMAMIPSKGTPPFMVPGYKGEAALIQSWRKADHSPASTAGQSDGDA